jgi:hypothetical protein
MSGGSSSLLVGIGVVAAVALGVMVVGVAAPSGAGTTLDVGVACSTAVLQPIRSAHSAAATAPAALLLDLTVAPPHSRDTHPCAE